MSNVSLFGMVCQVSISINDRHGVFDEYGKVVFLEVDKPVKGITVRSHS